MPFGHPDPAHRLYIVAALAAAAALCPAPLTAQQIGRTPSQQVASAPVPPSSVDHLHGVVINSLDGKPVPRVLVTSAGNQGLAVLTDYQGRFSFDLRRALPQAGQPQPIQPAASFTGEGTTLPFNLRKPGYISSTQVATVPRFTPSGPEPEIHLPITPAGLISGHISSSTGTLPPFLNVQVRRKQVNEGTAFYGVVAAVQVDASGNYRFPELAPGDYKISTQASTDNSASRSPRTQQPDSVPGTLPAAYPDATAAESGPPIHVGPGATVIADLNLRSAPFYRVTIPISPAVSGGIIATLSPAAPGLLLSYNPRAGGVVGFLPDGAYTVHLRGGGAGRAAQPPRNLASGRGAQPLLYPGQQNSDLAGTVTLQVADSPVKTEPVVLHPGFDLPVNIRAELSSPDTSQGAAQRLIALANGQQMVNPQFAAATLNLTPIDLGAGSLPGASSVPELNGEVHIPNVSEGAYRVRVFLTRSGYVASVSCGALDLHREPLVVGPSGVTAPIEVTLRDDGASLKLDFNDNTLPGEPSSTAASDQAFVSVSAIPLDSPMAPALFSMQLLHPPAAYPYNSQMGQFTNIAPGRYLILAVRTNRNPLMSLEYNDPKVREALLAKGTIVTLSPNQKAEVRVPVLPAEPEN